MTDTEPGNGRPEPAEPSAAVEPADETGADDAKAFAEQAGIDPTPEKADAYRARMAKDLHRSVDDPEPLEPPD